MPEFCTCGAQLPPDARFCHKCGKPQRDEPLIVQEAPPAPPPQPVAPPPPPAIGFRNRQAVRVAMLGALLVILLTMLLNYAWPLWVALAGFLCVNVYSRRTGEILTVGAGARMGWITGLFSYLIFAVLSTPGLVQQVRSGELYKNLQDTPFFRENPAQLRQILSDPVMVGITILFVLMLLLVLFAAFSMAGGALGAKTLKKG